MEFRPVNEDEITALASLQGKGRTSKAIQKWFLGSVKDSSLLVHYQTFKGGFTICTVKLPSGIILNGASRKSNKDKFKRIKGEMIAFVRAITESQEIKINNTTQESTS